ncbi:MAG: hypothetical protein WDM81_13020 [Rhizomicrobium sp.]
MTGIGLAGVFEPQRLAGIGRVVQRQHGGRRDQRERLAEPRQGFFHARPFAADVLFLGLVAAGAEIEDLGIAGIDAERAARLRLGAADIVQIRLDLDVAMHEALHLLEGDGVGPDQADAAAVGAQRALRQIAGLGRPTGMRGARIVPVHRQRAIAGVEIEADETAGIGLLVDQRDGRLHAQEAAIDFVAELEIRARDVGRDQRPDHLRIARTDQLDAAFGQQLARRVDPGRIARRDFLQREAAGFDADRTVLLRQPQQRPVTARDDLAALLLLDGREGEIEMEQGEELQRAGGAGDVALGERGVHAVTILRQASASLAVASAASRDAPTVRTMAAEGRLSPAAGMMSPGLAVTITSATPEIFFASSMPSTETTRPALGKA